MASEHERKRRLFDNLISGAGKRARRRSAAEDATEPRHADGMHGAGHATAHGHVRHPHGSSDPGTGAPAPSTVSATHGISAQQVHTVAGASRIDAAATIASTTSYSNVASATQLNSDLTAIDTASQQGTGSGTVYTISLQNGATLTEAADLSAVNLKGSDKLIIEGNGATLDGGGAYRGLFVYHGTVSISDLTIQHAVAIGGTGGSGAGGGAGLGGGLFIAGTNNVDGSGNSLITGGNVTLSDVTFINDGAVGGQGGRSGSVSAGGGGGMSGNGGNPAMAAGGGGGGIGRSALGGSGSGGAGQLGIVVGAAAGGHGGDAADSAMGAPSSSGGSFGGGGGAGFPSNNYILNAGGGGGVGGQDGHLVRGVPTSGGNYTVNIYGGNGGFGGGGGGLSKGYHAGSGGFGGGGGDASKGTPGAGGFGGGGAFLADGGFGGGNGSNNTPGTGGGGLGAGGAIFVQEGGQLTLAGGVVIGAPGGDNTVSEGTGGLGGEQAQSGQAFASGIYLQGNGGPLTFDTSSTAIQTVSDVIGDDTGSAAAAGYNGPGSYTKGSVGILVEGNGVLELSGANTYTGTTTIQDTASLAGDAANTFSGASAFIVGKGTNILLDYNQTIASLADGPTGGGTVTAGFGTATLTLAGSATTGFSGKIVDGGGFFGTTYPLSLVKQGAGVQTLSGANSYSGGTTITSGTLDLASAATFTGTTLVSAAAGTGAITFFGTGDHPAALALDAAAQPTTGTTLSPGPTFGNTLTDFNNNDDTLDLKGFSFDAVMPGYVSDGTSLTVMNATGQTETFALSNGVLAYTATADSAGDGTLIRAAPVCYVAGTLIRTTRSDVAVEALAVGDLVTTASGTARPVVWLGHRTIDCRKLPRSHEAMPIRIAAHAFGENCPARDLFLSPCHPVLVGADEDGTGGHLVPIMCLINGTTIERAEVDEVTYWHVELDEHDILLAEGLPAESYIDLGSRPWFAGANGALYDPDMALPGMPGRCRPVAIDGPVVEAERARLDQNFAMRLASACAWPDKASFAFG